MNQTMGNASVPTTTGAKMSSRVHTLRRVPIACPNASPIGYGKCVADPGDLISYKEHCADGSYMLRLARVVGRVNAPADGPICPEVKGKICAVALNDEGTTCYERWIDPSDVVHVNRPAPNFMHYFMTADPSELVKASEYGSASASHTDWQDNPLPCGFPGCTAPHQHRPDGTPNRMK